MGIFFQILVKNLDFIEKLQKLDLFSKKSENLGCSCDRSNYDEKEIEFRAVMRLSFTFVWNRPKLLQLLPCFIPLFVKIKTKNFVKIVIFFQKYPFFFKKSYFFLKKCDWCEKLHLFYYILIYLPNDAAHRYKSYINLIFTRKYVN